MSNRPQRYALDDCAKLAGRLSKAVEKDPTLLDDEETAIAALLDCRALLQDVVKQCESGAQAPAERLPFWLVKDRPARGKNKARKAAAPAVVEALKSVVKATAQRLREMAEARLVAAGEVTEQIEEAVAKKMARTHLREQVSELVGQSDALERDAGGLEALHDRAGSSVGLLRKANQASLEAARAQRREQQERERLSPWAQRYGVKLKHEANSEEVRQYLAKEREEASTSLGDAVDMTALAAQLRLGNKPQGKRKRKAK